MRFLDLPGALIAVEHIAMVEMAGVNQERATVTLSCGEKVDIPMPFEDVFDAVGGAQMVHSRHPSGAPKPVPVVHHSFAIKAWRTGVTDLDDLVSAKVHQQDT